MSFLLNRPAGLDVAVVTLPLEVIHRLLPKLFHNAPIEAY